MRKKTTKPKKLRKLFAVTMAVICTLAGVNIASADTDISNFSQLQEFITNGTEATGNIINNITDVGSAIGAVTRDNLTLDGFGYYIDGKNLYSGFTIDDSINSFVLNNVTIRNFAKNRDGGAIYNANGTIGDIKANFKGNHINASSYNANGGAIYNHTIALSSEIGNIVGNFTNNYAFAENKDAKGGAIRNSGTIGNITGIFESNYAKAGTHAFGGAIYNYMIPGEAKMGNITGSFINNAATSVNNAYGGAIFTANAQIGDITGSFINNRAISQNAAEVNGGAICNYAFETYPTQIGNISGDFINNYVSGNNYARGGAIYNDAHGSNTATIDSLSGLFTGNFAQGAIAQGGAIWNSGTITLKDAIFKDNYVLNNGVKIYNDIYNTGTLNINGNVSMTGGIADAATPKGTTNIGDDTHVSYLKLGKDTILNQDKLVINNESTLDLLNANVGTSEQYKINSLKTDATGAKFKVDIADEIIDVLNFDSVDTSATVGLSTINIVDDFNPSDPSQADEFAFLSCTKTGTELEDELAKITDNTDTIKVATEGHVYTFRGNSATGTDPKGEKGKVIASRVNDDSSNKFTLQNIIQNTNIQDAYKNLTTFSLTKNITLDSNLGELTYSGIGSRSLTIYGNGHTIDAKKDATTQYSGIFFKSEQNLTIQNVIMQNFANPASGMGAVLYNEGNSVNIDNSTFNNNSITDFRIFGSRAHGGVIYNESGIAESIINISNSSFADNSVTANEEAHGGVIYNNRSSSQPKNYAVVNISNSTFKNNTASGETADGAVINNACGIINLSGINKFENNKTNDEFNDIANYGDLNITSITVMEGGITGNGATAIGNGSTPTLLKLGPQATLVQDTVVFNNGTLDVANGAINTLNFNSLSLTGPNNNIFADTNLLKETMDSIYVSAFDNISNYKITLNPNLPTSTRDILTNPDITLYPIDKAVTGTTRADFAMAIDAVLPDQVTSPIFIYTPLYDSGNGTISVIANSFNPSVLASSVGAQVGAYLTQNEIYQQAFGTMDQTMLMTQKERTAMKFANKYAGVNNGVMSFSPNQIPEESKGMWFRPYASFEKVNLGHGPEVENNSYGMLFGGDSGLIELSRGWDMVWGAYAGYTGSHQNYDGVGIYQNGGTLGLNASWYKGNFFTGLTANVGASIADADTMYGHENFTMLTTGIASKSGYNWELFNDRFIVQPNFLISYSFVNTFNYTNAAGVNIGSSPLNAIQIVPGLKLIGNLPHGWQPYLSVQMVWNIMDETKFYANDVNLPAMSVDPYIQYGVGLQKRWGERFTGFGQVMFRNGGRTGVALNAGFRFAIGKEASNIDKNLNSSTVPMKKTKIAVSAKTI